jgi:hypothetical protein
MTTWVETSTIQCLVNLGLWHGKGKNERPSRASHLARVLWITLRDRLQLLEDRYGAGGSVKRIRLCVKLAYGRVWPRMCANDLRPYSGRKLAGMFERLEAPLAHKDLELEVEVLCARHFCDHGRERLRYEVRTRQDAEERAREDGLIGWWSCVQDGEIKQELPRDGLPSHGWASA